MSLGRRKALPSRAEFLEGTDDIIFTEAELIDSLSVLLTDEALDTDRKRATCMETWPDSPCKDDNAYGQNSARMKMKLTID